MLRVYLLVLVLAAGAISSAPDAIAGACVGIPPDLLSCTDCIRSRPGPHCAWEATSSLLQGAP